jgi:HEAT repeats
MDWLTPILGVAVPLLLGGAFWLGRALPRAAAQRSLLSPVTQQHLHLFQGGRLSEAAVATAKARLGALLSRGEVEQAEASLRPGLGFAVQVQALAELGSPHAGAILRKQLRRRLSDDPVEQSWYWIDLAHGLRRLNRAESLPDLLRCPASAGGAPLGQFFAAETACCAGFADYLARPASPLGRAALRVLHQALRGLRFGVQPRVLGDGALGTAVAKLWRRRPARTDPLIARVLVEVMRQLQRADHTERALAGDPYAAEGLRRQLGELLALEDAFADYLDEAPAHLLDDLAVATDARRPDLLSALDDLQADAAAVVLARVKNWPAADRAAAVDLLAWSHDTAVGPWLVAWATQWVQPERRARRPPRAVPPARPGVPPALPYTAVLRALRNHRSPVVEAFLLTAARDWDPTHRAAAVSSFGWRAPVAPAAVAASLTEAREDGNPDVRLAAQAALARLGERRALQWFRQSLAGEPDAPTPAAIRRIAAEGLTLLWPDLDQLADAEDAEVAHHAREALEQLREDALGGL